MAIQPWRLRNSRFVFEHHWYRLRQDTVELPDGRVLDDYFVSVRPEIVVVFALTCQREVLCVRQFRQGIAAVTLELPAGFFSDELAEAAAARELWEETGYRCPHLQLIGRFASDASRHTNYIHAFLGRDAVCVGAQALDASERSAGVEVNLIPLTEFTDLLRRGALESMSTAVTAWSALDQLSRMGVL